MKNDANPPSTPATTTSITMMPMFIAIVRGESLFPKQTGHASAARGAPSIPIAKSILRIVHRSPARTPGKAGDERLALQSFRFPLEGGAIQSQPAATRQRDRGGH